MGNKSSSSRSFNDPRTPTSPISPRSPVSPRSIATPSGSVSSRPTRLAIISASTTSNPRSRPTPTPNSAPPQRQTTQIRQSPMSVSVATSTTSSAPPPYTLIAEPGVADTPPPLPPRDHLAINTQLNSNGANHRASYHPTQNPGVGSQRHPRRASSGGSGGQRDNYPAGANRNINVGGFVAQMMPTTGVGSNHTQVHSMSPGGSVSNTQTNPFRTGGRVTTSPTRAGPNLARSGSVEDPLELLKKYDTVCLVDDSSSMEGPLWYEAREALAGIAEVAAKYDTDGIDIYFLNSQLVGKNMRNAVEVKRLFDRVLPRGITPTGEKLEELLLDYLLRLEAARDAAEAGDVGAMRTVKPVNFVVITDGAATDDPEPVILQAARRLDARSFPLSQVGIQFVQIGNDQEAADALRELDDGLATAHGTRDIVDTVPFSASGGVLTTDLLTKILLGGINRRVDRRKASQ